MSNPSNDLITEPWAKFLNFMASLFLFIVLPLIPILVQLLFYGKVESQSLYITITMYAAGVSVSSKNVVIFSMGLTIAIFFAVALGVLPVWEATNKPKVDKATLKLVGYICLGVVILLQAIEKRLAHFVKGVRTVNFHI